jgi:Lar family restriction alleviation protein
MKMIELKPCPFCGSTKLKINSKSTKAGYNGRDNIVYRATYSVRCNKCHARGGAIGGKVLSLENYPINIPYPLPSWATTWQELKAKAVVAWNNRLEIN